MRTLFVGVDIHKETHTMACANVGCEKLSGLTFPNSIPGFEEALSRIRETAEKHSLEPLVGLEDSGGNGLAFARFLVGRGLPVKTVNPVWVKRNRSKSTHPEKSDSRDALEIAIVSVQRTDRLPDFTLTQKTEFAKEIGVLVREREELVCGQTKLKNKLHAALQKLWGAAYLTVYQKNVFGKRSLAFWLRHPAARDFKKSTRPVSAKPAWILNTKPDDLPPVNDTDRNYVRRLVSRLGLCAEQIGEIDEELKRMVSQHYPYLLTYPGCGAVTAAKLIAYIKDIGRFPGEGQLAKYAGIAPRKYESGKSKRDVSSTRGHSALRRAFKTIALAQIGRRGNQKGKEYFRKKVKEGKRKTEALKCLMRQNVKIIFRIMKEERPYY